MAEIRCPMCGKPNPAELDVCQYCEARLKPLTDELARSQPPIHPGDEPTDQDTGQLEPILPQWLRDVRQQARESAEETSEQFPEEEAAQPSEEVANRLAGLQSQSEEDEEIPDWLAGLRGEVGKTPPEETSTEEDDLAALKSMLGENAPVPEESEASELPDWISGLDADQEERATEEPARNEPQPAASSSDFGWNADFEAESTPQAESAEDETPFDTELPAWLQGADETLKDETESGPPAWMSSEEPALTSESQDVTPPASEGDLPDWLASLGEETEKAAPPQEAEQPATQSTTDWLAALGEETEEIPPQQDTGQSEAQSTTDWLTSLGEETAEAASKDEASQPAAEGEVPDWLSSFGEKGPEDVSQPEAEETAATGEMPDWLASIGEESSETPQEAQPAGEGELPDWLSSLGEESAATEGKEFVPAAESVEEPQPPAEAEVPDWLASMGEGTAETEQPTEEPEISALEGDEVAVESEATPAFVDDEGKPISTEDVEAIFSMDMPDWLSDTKGVTEGEPPTASPEAQGEELRPADLPDWVQAMRPVESVISETEGEAAEEQPMEQRGPLAGLRGVLPAVPGIGPTSKPKAFSIKLQASEDQQSSAALLEQMLAEEISPKAVSTQKVVLTQRLLRWVITILLLLVIAGAIFSGTQINPMPTSAPVETSAALNYIQKTLPADAPVLLVFDYQASLSGELEAAAAPLVDHMLTLKHPRLTLLSSTPVGSGLAERFIEPFTTPANHNYQRGQNFIDLGYLPGGASGVLSFSVDPEITKPLTVTGENAWSTNVLQNVKQLSDFAAIILLTDDIETARIWIEQTEGARGDAQFLVVSSAQSGPMLMPYVQSGQIDGMVTGLDGSAPIEQVNSGRPGVVRSYWDAYGFGLMAAVVLITIGALWSLAASWQAHRKEQGDA
jgi:hypothetical protein